MIREYRLLATFLTVIAVTVTAHSPVHAQEGVAYNTELFGTYEPSGAGARFSGLWGYTDPNGREYVLLGGYTGTHVVDISEAPLKEVDFYPGPTSGWREMTVYDHYGYVVSEGGGGLQIIDLSGLPDSTSLVKADTSVFKTGHTIRQEGKWIYVHGSNVQAGANQGTLIFDVASDPENPVLVGQYDRDYVHDAAVRNDTMYAAMINDGRLDIVYLGEDRSNPTLVAEITYPGAGTHNSALSRDGRYVFTTDEVGQTDKTLKVWDLADLDDIVKVADYTSDENSIIHNVRTRGTTAFVSWYMAGTRVLDVSDPVNPVEIGFYDPFPGSAMSFNGNWEVYPFFPSGKVAGSDMSNGMYVFTFEGAATGVASITIRDSVTGDPLKGVHVRVPELNRTYVSDASGMIEMVAAEGDVSYEAALLNYRQKSGTVTLTSAGNDVDILLSPLALRDITVVAIDSLSQNEIDRGLVAYSIETRGEGHFEHDSPGILSLPVDSGYSVRIGAWGWKPRSIEIESGLEGIVEVSLQRGYQDDAELDLGWTFGEPDDDGTAGYWERGTPNGVEFRLPNSPNIIVEPGEDHTPGTGTQAFFTQIIGPDATQPGSADVDSGRVTLTSPRFDLSDYYEPWIHFTVFYSNDAIDLFPTDDHLYIRMSNDDGVTWEDIVTLDTGTRDWRSYAFPIEQLIEPSADMRFRIVAADSNEQGWVEAGLDDFLVADSGSPPNSVQEGLYSSGALEVRPNPLSADAPMLASIPMHESGLIELYTSDGRLAKSVAIESDRASNAVVVADARTLAPGHYLMRFRDRNGRTVVTQVVVY